MDIKEFTKKIYGIKKGKLELSDFISEQKKNFKTYVPIVEKDEIISRILTHVAARQEVSNLSQLEEIKIDEDYNLIHEYETTKIIYIACEYFGVITVRNEDELFDLLHESGIITFLKNNTNGDFDYFIDYCDKLTGINLYTIYDKINDLIKEFPSNEKVKDFTQAIENLDENKIKQITEAVKYNNPLVEEIVKILEQEGLNSANNLKEDKKE